MSTSKQVKKEKVSKKVWLTRALCLLFAFLMVAGAISSIIIYLQN